MANIFETIGTRTRVRNFNDDPIADGDREKFSKPVSGHQLRAGTSNGFFVL